MKMKIETGITAVDLIGTAVLVIVMIAINFIVKLVVSSLLSVLATYVVAPWMIEKWNELPEEFKSRFKKS